jgi:sigma-54 dependent transcriptional regulator, flagellar regulatory protein
MNPTPGDAARSLVGQSPQIRQIRRTIEKLARSRSPVVLLGESGTGKEVVAHAIYEANPVGRFVPIDCGSLVGPLMESELFGHTKGAFTGAGATKKGLLELADGGTAFFDEIGDLPLEMQVKLLRVLQEREFRPVGSTEQHKVDMRVIAATHRDLEQRVKEGTFRQDLYYRLDVGRIRLPTLRERKQDLPLLIDHFLAALNSSHRFTDKALALMQAYDWPGNVRELRNVIERVVMLNSGPWVDIPGLPTALQTHHRAADLPQLALAVEQQSGDGAPAFQLRPPPAVVPLTETEKRAIMEALGFTRGDRGKAARLLQISRTTLYRKLKEYQIE